MIATSALAAIPDGLRQPLLAEYQLIVQNFFERRWSPSEMSGGKFAEIAYSIIEGYAASSYPAVPSKPQDFAGACRKLENATNIPRSFRFTIPRTLSALYEVRNNRGVGHVGGDVDANHMDATYVLSNCSWVMAEFVRVFHQVSVSEAQQIVDGLVEIRTPLIWEGDTVRRVLNPNMLLEKQILLLASTSSGSVAVSDLMKWTDSKSASYFQKLLKRMHKDRLIELGDDMVTILPPGVARSVEILRENSIKLA